MTGLFAALFYSRHPDPHMAYPPSGDARLAQAMSVPPHPSMVSVKGQRDVG